MGAARRGAADTDEDTWDWATAISASAAIPAAASLGAAWIHYLDLLRLGGTAEEGAPLLVGPSTRYGAA